MSQKSVDIATASSSASLQPSSSLDTHLLDTADSLSQDDHPDPIPSYLHQISYAPDDDPFGESRRPVNTRSLSEERQWLIEACADYVFNSLPTHLIRIADMTIVTRNEIWDQERPHIERIQDEQLRALRYEYSQGLGWHWTGFLERSWCEVYARDFFKFAIFSHRWGDREPLFQDMARSFQTHPVRPIPSGPGYDKLRMLCEKAQTDFRCRYVWSDTCCINKESSSELEEAIRSMYRWYSIANVCIVHLGRSSSVNDFDNEPWFTRGWTLQELLAPKVIRFYGENWNPISPNMHELGDQGNEEIVTAIERVTRIPKISLQHFLPSCELVSEIMVWSAKRKTTRVEDRAYSLLGLLNVSIPIAYGEGDRAFYRLMAALATECTTPTFFAWAGRHSDFSNALPASPACYARVAPNTGLGADADADADLQAGTHHRTLGDTGHPSYEVIKLGLVAHLLMFRVHRKLTLKRGFHVGTTWHFVDADAPLEPFVVRAGTAAVLPPDVPIMDEDYHTYALGVVDFAACPDAAGPEGQGHEHEHERGKGTLAHGRRYMGILMMKVMWGWEKLSADRVLVLNCTRDTIRPVERVLLLHSTLLGR